MTSEITDAIARLAPGESDAIKHLFDVSYVELKRLAHSRLWAANLKQSYATESLLHESYLRLVNQKTLCLPDRKHFFAYASKVMRSIILDAVREANAERRGGGQADLTLKTEIAEVTPRGATAMFMTALVKTRKFRVLERARMAEGIAAEKALNQQGMTTGQSGRAQYVSANYMFEATVSEATTDANKTSFSLGVASAAAGKGWSSDTIDVRVTDVESGIVVDAIDVRREIKGVETKVGGVTKAITNLLTRGRGGALADALAPTDEFINARRDSVDKALREAIEEAVNEIAKRFAAD